jgi:prepilin-type N-terminal cleavage/methylation domain-containing protein
MSISPKKFLRAYNSQANKTLGFTLLELVIVIAVIGAMYGIISFSPGSRIYWEREAFLRRINETITFLYHRAVADGVHYRMEFHMNESSECFEESGQYCIKIGEIVAEEENTSNLGGLLNQSAGVGLLTLELAVRQNPSIGQYQMMVEPRNFPSLSKPIYLPFGASFIDVRTMRGLETPNQNQSTPPYITFSPRGFSEFAVIHLAFAANDDQEQQVTILVNPWTGIPETYREYKDFEWSYGRS